MIYSNDFVDKLVYSLVVVVVGLLMFSLIKNLVKKIFNRTKGSYEVKRRATVVSLIVNIIKFFIFGIIVMMILDNYGVDTKGILASLGIAGVVLGFALQDTVQDFLSGISIVMENYYVIGDYIKIGDFVGEVVDFSLKSTKVLGFSGEKYIFANRNMNSVINLSQERSGVKIDIPTAYEEDVTNVEKVIEKIIAELKNDEDIFDDTKYLGVDDLADSAVIYSIMIYCKAGSKWSVRRKALRLIKNEYDVGGIKIPYTQIEVHDGKKIV